MDISRYISDLLFEHECVIIPGFGGFVCSYAPANIHPVQNMFHPPSKSVLFNEQLKTNDGLLANYISVCRKITFQEALGIIEKEVDEALATINSGSQVTIENIGIFYSDLEGNLQFKQDTKTNFLKESYGLSSFISPKINRNSRKSLIKHDPQFTNRTAKTNRKKQVALTNLAFLIIPVMLVFGYFYFDFDAIDSDIQSKTSLVPDLNIENKAIEKPSYQISNHDNLNNETGVLDNQKNEIADISLTQNTPSESIVPEAAHVEKNIEKPVIKPENKSKDVVNEPAAITTKVAQPLVTTGKMFYLIGGSFENVENADKLISKYAQRGYNPQIIGQAANGYFRVSLQSYLRRQEAMTELERIRANEIPGAWVLRQ